MVFCVGHVPSPRVGHEHVQMTGFATDLVEYCVYLVIVSVVADNCDPVTANCGHLVGGGRNGVGELGHRRTFLSAAPRDVHRGTLCPEFNRDSPPGTLLAPVIRAIFRPNRDISAG